MTVMAIEENRSDQWLALLHDLSKTNPEVKAALKRAQEDRESSNVRPLGRARKISISMPEDLTAAVQQRVGRGEFSQYVTEAVSRHLELDLLAELVAILEEEHGPIPEEYLAEADALWPTAD